MPAYKFTDQDSFELLDEGEYKFRVVGVDSGLMAGTGVTSGSDYVDVKCKFFDADGKPRAMWTEKLILHESCFWKVDSFIKASNYLHNGKPPVEGDDIQLNEDTLVGLQGWCKVYVNVYTNKQGDERENNRVDVWLTEREKLPRDTSHLKTQEDPFA
jgi:hypothetical protein